VTIHFVSEPAASVSEEREDGLAVVGGEGTLQRGGEAVARSEFSVAVQILPQLEPEMSEGSLQVPEALTRRSWTVIPSRAPTVISNARAGTSFEVGRIGSGGREGHGREHDAHRGHAQRARGHDGALDVCCRTR
jgi:hypothetical protein